MKNYSEITESLDITTKQYVDQGLTSKADVNDIPTSIDGLSGGTLTSPLIIKGGDQASASKLVLNQDANGQITDNSTSTLFGFMSKTVLTVGGNGYTLALRGNGARPTYKGSDLALYSDISTIDTSNLAKLNAENTFTETQTVKSTSGNAQSKIFSNYFYSSDGTNYSLYKSDGIQFKTAVLSFPTTTGTLALLSDIPDISNFALKSELTAHINTVATQTTLGHVKMYVEGDTLYLNT